MNSKDLTEKFGDSFFSLNRLLYNKATPPPLECLRGRWRNAKPVGQILFTASWSEDLFQNRALAAHIDRNRVKLSITTPTGLVKRASSVSEISSRRSFRPKNLDLSI